MNKLLLLATASIAVSAQAQVIDDFSTSGVGQYTLTRINDAGFAEANVSFSDASGVLTTSYAGTVNAAEQVLFLRSDFSLPVGSRLMADVLFATQTSQMDFGIAIAATATPPASSSGTTDVRATFNWASISVRPSQDAVRNNSSINGAVVTGSGVLAAVETTVSSLYITRTSATDFTLGYVDSGNVPHDARTISFTTTDLGTAVGFYGDLRAAGDNLNGLDNLRIVAVPEPSSYALMAAGGGALAWMLRRRQS